MTRVFRRLVAAAAVLLLSATGRAQSRSRSDCETAYPAAWGQAGKDVVWVPTSDAVVHGMLTITAVTPQDLVLDLGAGDGKIAIAAAKPPFGARSVGIEYDPQLARRAGCLVQAEGVADRVRIVQGDIFKEDLGAPTVVTLYLLPQLNRCVRSRILALEPGTRVASHQFSMAEWPPDQSVEIQGRKVFLWIVPARVDGTWDFRDRRGQAFSIDLRQTFATLAGEVTRGGTSAPLLSAELRGPELRFTFGAAGATEALAGTVRGSEIEGSLQAGSGGPTVAATGALRGPLRDAPWAGMPADCGAYYGR
jgi:SAM-dependent methyltransferase